MFGKWLADKRRKAQLTQEELASRIPCSRAYISSLERNVIESKSGRPIQPSKDFIIALARALSIPSNEALTAAGYAVTEHPTINKNNQLLNFFELLPADRQNEIIAFCELWFHRYAKQEVQEFEIISQPKE